MPAPHEDTTVPMSLGARVATLIAILGPLVGLVVAVALFWGWGVTWVDLGLLIGMYLLTALGITVGYHRLFVHRSFETNIVVKFVLAVLGSMAIQGSLLKWVALHRRHHQHSDQTDDPHPPHHQGPGILGWLRGYWRAHIGWLFEPEPADLSHYVPDLEKSRVLRVASGLLPLWVALGLVIPAVLGGLLSGTEEGWHNTHHAFPTSARHGLRWWQINVSYGVIRALELVGFAWNVKLPSKQAQAERETHAETEPSGLSPGNRCGLC